MSIKVEGLDKILVRLNQLQDTSNLDQALGKACALVERSAKEKAPKGEGDLRRSITSKVDSKKHEGVVYTPLEYAPYVEFCTGLFAEKGNGRKDLPWHYKDEKGKWHTTSGMKPQPYMRPALKENRTKIIQTIKEGMNND